MTLFVKICGITSPAAAAAAVEAGANAIGFVFAESSRRVTTRAARACCAGLPERVIRIAVMRHPTKDDVARVAEEFAPDWLQTDAEDFASIALPAGCAALPVYRNGRVPAGAELPARLLFEGAVSGSGRMADWDEGRRLAARTQLILAGGLDFGNVADAIRRVKPWGVDVSTGVERAPGVKDEDKIRLFVARARAAAEGVDEAASRATEWRELEDGT